ncbi:LOB domain-containing protein 28-like [Salvia hispanica]|uniref:LOB domain-containing protein 28-like n=1 Tax=Salvia hispanica TaxID=49212 RepID=UPI0020098439|nr:LOB domain-containing protein 28-like [Salvia hispanica]
MQSPNHILHTTKTPIKSKTLTPRPSNPAAAAPSQPRSHGSTTQACAACKYQRRKCASDCILAPYFPHDRQPQFLNAHRLFGVSNIVKIVAGLNQPEKDHAMRTIIFQSDARASDPVGGCYRIIRDLEHQISLAKAELEIVLHHLALCRAAAQQEGPPPEDDDQGWREPYGAEEEVAAVEDLNSWGCMGGPDAHAHAHAESTSSSFPHDDHRHARKCSLEECNDDMIRPIFDRLVCDDVRDDEFELDSDGNIIPRNITNSPEKAAIKEDDECFSYIQDHQDLKAAATIFSLTNCDL